MTKIRTLIVDDEPLARERLHQLLEHEPEIELAGECADGVEAIEVISREKPDLIFLDVQMPELDGFGVLEAIPGRPPVVVFVTAYDQFALRAFEVHAVDYLLKPYSADRLVEALGRARERLSKGERLPFDEVSKAARPANTRASRVLVRDGSRVHVLPVAKIAYVQAQDDYAAFFCDGKEYLKEQTLTEVESSLDPAKFVRIHRSYLLNLDWLARVELDERENRIAVLTDGRRLPVSRAGYTRLAELL